MRILSPFGPKIASLKLSKSSIRKINIEVDKIISNKNLLKVYLLTNFVDKNIKKKISKKIRIIKYGSSINVLNNRYLISFVSFFYFFFILKKRFFQKNTLVFSAQNSIASILLSKILNYKICIY